MKTNSPSPLVSILMLTYNRAHFIGEAIQSVLTQTYQNFELIIIDDGSTDDTSEVVSSFKDSRIRYIPHTENKGLIARRQESLTYVTGTYVAILDSDDIWISQDKLASQVAYLEENPAYSIIGTFISLINVQGANIGKNSYSTADLAIRRHILSRNQFAHSSVLMRADALAKTAGYRDTGLAEDLDLFLQLGMVGKFANLPEYSTAYRIHTESFNSSRLEMARAVLGIVKNHKTNYPNYFFAFIKCHLRILFLTFKRFLVR